MTISAKQQMLNDMLANLRSYIEQNKRDLQCLLIVSVEENDGFKNHVQAACSPDMAHYFGHTMHEIKDHGMEDVFNDIMGGIACSLVAEGIQSIDDLLKTSPTTVH